MSAIFDLTLAEWIINFSVFNDVFEYFNDALHYCAFYIVFHS